MFTVSGASPSTCRLALFEKSTARGAQSGASATTFVAAVSVCNFAFEGEEESERTAAQVARADLLTARKEQQRVHKEGKRRRAEERQHCPDSSTQQTSKHRSKLPTRQDRTSSSGFSR